MPVVETITFTDPAEFERAVRCELGSIHRSDPKISDNGFEAEVREIMRKRVLEGYGGGLRWVLVDRDRQTNLHTLAALLNRKWGGYPIRAVILGYGDVGAGEV